MSHRSGRVVAMKVSSANPSSKEMRKRAFDIATTMTSHSVTKFV